MTYRGHVSNGIVVLDDQVTLPEGLSVSIEPMATPQTPPPADDDVPTLYERLEPLIGKLEGLPPDASVNVDHYLYGVAEVSGGGSSATRLD